MLSLTTTQPSPLFSSLMHPNLGMDGKVPWIFAKRLPALSVDLSWACSGICLPWRGGLPLRLSDLLFLHFSSVAAASHGLVDLSLGFPGKQDYDSHSDPHGSPILLKGDGVCPVLPGILLESEGQDPCTESHSFVFILLAQLRGSLPSSPDLRSWYLVPWFLCESTTWEQCLLHICRHRVREENAFKGKSYCIFHSISLPHL